MPYLILFGWSFLAATLVPIGSEAAVVVMIRQGHPIVAVVAVATLGNYLGACSTYGIARLAARALEQRQLRASARRAADVIAKYGAPALILSWVPLIGDAIVAAAGAAGMGFAAFSFWTALGKLLRYLAIGWASSAW